MDDIYHKVLKLFNSNNVSRAEILAKRSLKKNDDKRLYYILAMIYFQKNLFSKSLIYINHFLKFSINNVDGLIVKTHILMKLGRYEETLKILFKIKDVDNRKSDILMTIGLCFLKIGDKKTAIKNFKESIKTENTKKNLTNIFNIFYQDSLLIESVIVLSRYKDFNNDLDFIIKYCKILLDLGKTKKALRKLHFAEKKFKGNIQVLNQLALTNLSSGNIVEAKKKFKNVIDIDPYNGLANNYLTRMDFKLEITQIQKLEKYFKNNEKNLNLMHISSALSNHYKKEKKIEKSVFFLNFSNKYYRKYLIDNFKWNLPQESRTLENIKKLYENIIFKKIKFICNTNIKPIFIVGLPRSGSTLLESIICRSTQIEQFGELTELNIAFKENILNKIKKDSDIKNIDTGSLNRVINGYSRKFNSVDSFFTDKLPLNFMYMGFINLFFPRSKIILCERNKNDNLLSIYESFFTKDNYAFSYSIEDLKKYYEMYMNHINFWKRNKTNFLSIKYENLIKTTEATVKKIFNFLEIIYSRDLLNFQNNKSNVLTASNYQVRQKINDKSIGKSKSYESLLDL